MSTGFNCEIRDVYRSLGEPILAPQDLILESLHISMNADGKNVISKVDVVVEKVVFDTSVFVGKKL